MLQITLNGSKGLKMPRNDSKWLLNDRISEITNLTFWDQKNSPDLSGQKKNHAFSQDKKKITQPLRTKKKIVQLLGTKEITSRDKKNHATSWDKKNHATSQRKKSWNHLGTSGDKKESRNL